MRTRLAATSATATTATASSPARAKVSAHSHRIHLARILEIALQKKPIQKKAPAPGKKSHLLTGVPVIIHEYKRQFDGVFSGDLFSYTHQVRPSLYIVVSGVGVFFQIFGNIFLVRNCRISS